MLFQDTPPDTSAYMIAGFSVFFLFVAIYLFSFFVRSRNLKADLDTLENLREEKQAPPPAPRPKKAAPTTKPKPKRPAGRSKPRKASRK